ncbi:hypothetical protein H2248_002244 [Termitomyces sp. 'cryptogamus']|nr:hypothetical protein H2248_002244 [Termitomyces sp. 'cryptogamus']
MSLMGVNDSLRDTRGRLVMDIAKGKDIAKLMHDSHTFLNTLFDSLFSTATPPSFALMDLFIFLSTLSLNLSYIDDPSGMSLLQEAARRTTSVSLDLGYMLALLFLFEIDVGGCLAKDLEQKKMSVSEYSQNNVS